MIQKMIIFSVIGVTMALCLTVVSISDILQIPNKTSPNVSAQISPSTNPPLPPQINGCYNYSQPKGWQKIPCASAAELNQIILNHP